MIPLNNSEKLYRSMFDRLPDGIVIIDTDGNIVESNETARRMLGYTSEEFQGIRISDISLEVPEKSVTCIGSLLKEGRADFEGVFRSSDGRTKNIRVISQVLTSSGEPLVFLIWRDVTESKQAEDKLEKLVAERTAEIQIALNCLTEEINARNIAEATLRDNEAKARHIHGVKLIGEMAAAVAHEVRNPLHALMSVTEALRQELKDNSELDLYIHHIHQQVERLSVLMKELLDLGKPVEPSNLRPESLVEICSAALDQWRHMPHGQGRKVDLIKPEDERDINVIADSQRLQQVLLNLLDNAAHHSPKDGEISVVIEEPVGGSVSFKVVDRGAGIPEEILPKIFGPFFSTRRGGTGLGLNIVKNIVESHGGSIILVNNAPAAGCTARITMPLAAETGR